MRILLIFHLLCTGLAVNASSPFVLFEENGKVGLKNEKGAVVINASFEALGWSNGTFSVVGGITGYKLDNAWGLINLKGQQITEPQYVNLEHAEGDKIIASKRISPIALKYGCIDLTGKVSIPTKYDGLKINGMYAIVFLRDSKQFNYGVVDLNHKEIIPLKYKRVDPIGNLRFGVTNFEGKTALFSEFGKKITDFTIDSISAFQNNYAIIHENHNQGIINRDGIIVVQPNFRQIEILDDGTIKAKKINEWNIVAIDNRILRSIQADELIPNGKSFIFETANKIGLLNDSLQPQIPAHYNFLGDLASSLLVAKQGIKYGLVRKDNSIVLPFQYDSLIIDRRYVRAQEKLLGKPAWILLDTFGVRKTERFYEFIKPFNGRFFETKNYGLAGAVNGYGKEIIPCVYDSIIRFNDDQITVRYHGQYGVIDYNENWLLPPQPNFIELVDADHYLILQDSNALFKNYNGDLIYFTDNKLEIEGNTIKETLPDGTEKIINFQGITISRTTPPITSHTRIISSEHEGFRGIKRNGKYGFIDAKGRLRIANRYEDIGHFSSGLASVRILGKWGYVDTSDKIAVNPSYEFASPFSKSMAIVKKEGYGLIDKSGNEILQTRYDSIYEIETGNFVLLKNNLRGLASAKGKVLIEPRFDKLVDIGNGYVIISSAGKYGVSTSDGLSVIPMTHDYISYLDYADTYLIKEESPWVTLYPN